MKDSTLSGVAVENDAFVNGDIELTGKSVMAFSFRVRAGSLVKGSITIDEGCSLLDGFILEGSDVDGVIDVLDSTINGRFLVSDSTICTKGDNGFNVVANTIDGDEFMNEVNVPGLNAASHVLKNNDVSGRVTYNGVTVGKDLKVVENTIGDFKLNVTLVTAEDGKIEIKNNELTGDAAAESNPKKEKRSLRAVAAPEEGGGNSSNNNNNRMLTRIAIDTEIIVQGVTAKELKIEDNKLKGPFDNEIEIKRARSGLNAKDNQISDKFVIKKNKLEGSENGKGSITIFQTNVEGVSVIDENEIADGRGFKGFIAMFDFNTKDLETFDRNQVNGGFLLGIKSTHMT